MVIVGYDAGGCFTKGYPDGISLGYPPIVAAWCV
jgi:hypothetical protein